jgi:hypothetical protein
VIALAQDVLAIIVATIAATATVSAAVVPILLKSRSEAHNDIKAFRAENHADHQKVDASVQLLAQQMSVLTQMVVDSVAELRAHTKWEESQKYASPEHIERLIRALKEQQ